MCVRVDTKLSNVGCPRHGGHYIYEKQHVAGYTQSVKVFWSPCVRCDPVVYWAGLTSLLG